jgi:hypothetical protein
METVARLIIDRAAGYAVLSSFKKDPEKGVTFLPSLN